MKTLAVDAILSCLDRSAARFRFPALDNGYVYPCASRLSLHRTEVDWGLVFETFGFAPRSSDPDLTVTTCASRLAHRKQPGDFASEAAYSQYLRTFPDDELWFFYPFDDDAWRDPDDPERVDPAATSVRVRGQVVPIPDQAALRKVGIEAAAAPHCYAFELCRYVAETRRALVLGTPDEITVNLPTGAVEILRLDAWHHPDTTGGEAPSDTETFRALAEVLATGDPSAYRTTEQPNNHWSNWPEGGTL